MGKLSSNDIKKIKSLKLKKFRTQTELFVVEGLKSVQEAIDWVPNEIVQIYSSSPFELDISQSGLEIETISEKEMERMTHLKTPSNHLAVVKTFQNNFKKDSLLEIGIDGVQDPGNLGTIIRIADWFGVQKVVCSKETVDCFNSKVVQATMGSLFRINIEYTDLESYIKDENIETLGAFMDGTPMKEYQLKERTLLLMGNEGKGVSTELEELVSSKISIPGNGNAESLNVGVATGILVSHLV